MKTIDHKSRLDRKIIKREYSREKKFSLDKHSVNTLLTKTTNNIQAANSEEDQDKQAVTTVTAPVKEELESQVKSKTSTSVNKLRAKLARSGKSPKKQSNRAMTQPSAPSRYIGSSTKSSSVHNNIVAYTEDPRMVEAINQYVAENRSEQARESIFRKILQPDKKAKSNVAAKTVQTVSKSKTSFIKLVCVASVSLILVSMISIIIIVNSISATLYAPPGAFWDTSNTTSLVDVCREHETLYRNSVIDGASIYADDLIEDGWCYPYVLNEEINWRNTISLYYAYVSDKDIVDPNVLVSGTGAYDYYDEVFWASNCVCYDFNHEYEFSESFDLSYVMTTTPYETTTLTFAYGFLVLCYHPDPYVVAAQLGFNEAEMAALDDYLSSNYDQSFSSLEQKIESGTGVGMIDAATPEIGNDWHKYCTWFNYGNEYRFEWCAAFVSWCAEQNGYIEAGIIPRSASCRSYFDWFSNPDNPGEFIYTWQGAVTSADITPEPGWLIIWERDDDHSRLNHIGIIESYDPETNYFVTIEGNTTNVSGGLVARYTNWRSWDDEVWGFCVPSYPQELTHSELTSIDIGICEEYMWIEPVAGNNDIASAALAANPVPQNMLDIGWEIIGILEAGNTISAESFEAYNSELQTGMYYIYG